MKQQIDSIFYKLVIDKNLSPSEKIRLIEETYENILEYITIYGKDEKEINTFSSYAHVIFSKKILENVDLNDFILYIEQKEQNKRTNEERIYKI